MLAIYNQLQNDFIWKRNASNEVLKFATFAMKGTKIDPQPKNCFFGPLSLRTLIFFFSFSRKDSYGCLQLKILVVFTTKTMRERGGWCVRGQANYHVFCDFFTWGPANY